jgi:hypothetical protein
MTIALESNTTSTSPADTYSPYKKPTPELASTYKPTHPGLLKVVLEKGQGDDGEDTYSSYLVAEQVSWACHTGIYKRRLADERLVLLVRPGHCTQLYHMPAKEPDFRRQSVLERTIWVGSGRAFRAQFGFAL